MTRNHITTSTNIHVRDQLANFSFGCNEHPTFTSLKLRLTKYGSEVTLMCADMTKKEVVLALRKALHNLLDETNELSCDWCGVETDNGNAHYLDELGVEDRVCSDCYKSTTFI